MKLLSIQHSISSQNQLFKHRFFMINNLACSQNLFADKILSQGFSLTGFNPKNYKAVHYIKQLTLLQ